MGDSKKNSIKKDLSKKILTTVLIVLAALLIVFALIKVLDNPKRIKASKTGFAFDTVVNITLYRDGNQEKADRLFELCSYYEDNYFSPNDTQSELYKINHISWTPEEIASGKPKVVELSSEMYTVMYRALKYYEITGGRYNIAVKPVTELWDFHNSEKCIIPNDEEIKTALDSVGVYDRDYEVEENYTFTDDEGNEKTYPCALIMYRPVTFDVGSTAKGFIADSIRWNAGFMRAGSLLIDLGGNICCGDLYYKLSRKTPTFTVEIDTSFLPEGTPKQIINVKPNYSVVTSGKYQRCFDVDGRHYHHIIDATTGYPVETDLASVTVVGINSGTCDALSTACFILGEEKSLALLEEEKCGAVFIYDDGTVHNHLKN